MIQKNKFIEELNELEKIAREYNFNSIVSEIEVLRNISENYKHNVLFVGSFSSGKSSLLNKYIGKELLAVGQSPETAQIGELYFSEDEHKIIEKKDGVRESVGIFENIIDENVHHVEYYVNSEKVKFYNDYILVDTPGFDSGIEAHNNALLQYMGKDTVYFLIIDIEHGTLSERAINFLKEVSQYSDEIAIILNKCDKVLPQKAVEIEDYIKLLVVRQLGRELPIICTSIYDEKCLVKIEALLTRFDPQHIYNSRMEKRIHILKQQMKRELANIRDNLAFDATTIENEIKERKSIQELLLKDLEKEKISLNRRLYTSTKQSIENKIEQALYDHVSDLRRAYMVSPANFQEQILRIIRPIITNEIDGVFVKSFDDIIKNIETNIIVSNGSSEEAIAISKSVLESVRNFDINNYKHLFNNVRAIKNNPALAKMYRVVMAGLATVTSFIAPVLEVILILLPDIITLLNKFFGKSVEERIEEELRNTVIPKIVIQMNTSLDIILAEVETQLIEIVESQINMAIQKEEESLQEALRQKEVNESVYEEKVGKLTELIESL